MPITVFLRAILVAKSSSSLLIPEEFGYYVSRGMLCDFMKTTWSVGLNCFSGWMYTVFVKTYLKYGYTLTGAKHNWYCIPSMMSTNRIRHVLKLVTHIYSIASDWLANTHKSVQIYAIWWYSLTHLFFVSGMHHLWWAVIAMILAENGWISHIGSKI